MRFRVVGIPHTVTKLQHWAYAFMKKVLHFLPDDGQRRARSHPLRFGNDVMTVEYGIDYNGTFAKYRVFESYAHMHKIWVRTAATTRMAAFMMPSSRTT